MTQGRVALFAPYRRPQKKEHSGWTGFNVTDSAAMNMTRTLGATGVNPFQAAAAAASGAVQGMHLDRTMSTEQFDATRGTIVTPRRARSPATARGPGSPAKQPRASPTRSPTPDGGSTLATMLASVQRTAGCGKLANQSFVNNATFVPSPLLPSDRQLNAAAAGSASSSRSGKASRSSSHGVGATTPDAAAPSSSKPSTRANGGAASGAQNASSSGRSAGRGHGRQRSRGARGKALELKRTYAGLPMAANRVLVDLKRTITRAPYVPETVRGALVCSASFGPHACYIPCRAVLGFMRRGAPRTSD